MPEAPELKWQESANHAGLVQHRDIRATGRSFARQGETWREKGPLQECRLRLKLTPAFDFGGAQRRRSHHFTLQTTYCHSAASLDSIAVQNRCAEYGVGSMEGGLPLIRSATRRPVAAPAVSPTCPWPKACTTFWHPLAGPMQGRPSGVDGRCP